MLIKKESDDEFYSDLSQSIKAVLMAFFASANEADLAIAKIEQYVNLMHYWNSIHNISSTKNNPSGWLENVHDSIATILQEKDLEALFYESKNYILDAGAGGGFPGIPLAIIFKQTQFILVDANRKKCSFLRTVKAKLALSNVTVVNKNLEDVAPVSLIITKAAFSPANAGILASSVLSTGRIIIWSTPMMADDFVKVLTKNCCTLLSQYDYYLPSNKRRSLLVFLKG